MTVRERSLATLLVLLFSFSFVSPFGEVGAAPGITAERIDQYLGEKGSPLSGLGSAFVEAGRVHDVDPRLVVAVAGAETSFGTRICAEYNAWNWFYLNRNQCSPNAFSSWEEGVNRVTKGLREVYLSQNRTTIERIAERYTATERDTWIRNVTRFYHTELGGYLDDLTFEETPFPTPVSTPGRTEPSRQSVEGRADSPFGIVADLAFRFGGCEDRAADSMANAGVTWIRERFCWGCIEYPRGNYRWQVADWFDHETAVESARMRGFYVVGVLGASRPAWTDENVPIEELLDYWRQFVTEVATKYGDSIDHWEIHNEENVTEYWHDIEPGARPNAAAYVQLIRGAYEAIREVDPTDKVVLGGLSPGDQWPASQDVVDCFLYLQQLHDAGGWPYFDVVAVHPYRAPDSPEAVVPRSWYNVDDLQLGDSPNQYSLVDELEALHELVARFGRKPIWITEIGWSVKQLEGRARERGTTPEVVQSDYLIRAYVQGMASSYVQKIIWYDFRDDDVTNPVEASFGIIRRDFSPKPAYRAYAAMTYLLEGTRFQGQVRGQQDHGCSEDDDVYEYRFVKGSQTIVVLWKCRGGDAPREVVVENVGAGAVQIIGPEGGYCYDLDTVPPISVTDGSISLPLTERPVFIVFRTPNFLERILAELLDEITKHVREWWEAQRERLIADFERWVDEQSRNVETWIETEMERQLEEICGGPVALLGGLIAALVANEARRLRR